VGGGAPIFLAHSASPSSLLLSLSLHFPLTLFKRIEGGRGGGGGEDVDEGNAEMEVAVGVLFWEEERRDAGRLEGSGRDLIDTMGFLATSSFFVAVVAPTGCCCCFPVDIELEEGRCIPVDDDEGVDGGGLAILEGREETAADGTGRDAGGFSREEGAFVFFTVEVSASAEVVVEISAAVT
jgi:hypothetical protein